MLALLRSGRVIRALRDDYLRFLEIYKRCDSLVMIAIENLSILAEK